MRKKVEETPRCNLCGEEEVRILHSDLTYWEYPGVFQVVECVNCQLVFTSPRPKPQDMQQYYAHEEYFAIESQEEGNELTEREQRYGNVFDLVLTQKKTGRILDIGAGTGLFLSKFKELGWEVAGMELNPEGVAYAKKHYKISLKNGGFDTIRLKENYFDVITLNGVLEHVYDPQATLERAYRLLKKNGLLVITVPSVDGYGRHMFGKHWFAWLPPQHLYHFAPKTLTSFLKQAGFRNITIKHNDHVQNYYILFQSLRYMKSPRFKTKKSGGLASPKYKSTFSLKKELGKIGGKVFARVVSRLEPLLKHGEVLVVVAKK